MRFKVNKHKSRSELPLPVVDQQLREHIRSLSGDNTDYWAFKHSRAKATSLYQYPAMMVPEVQRELIGALVGLQGRFLQRLLDPFVGSGTVAVEGMLQGLQVYGRDINPLAVLLSTTRTGPVWETAFRDAAEEVTGLASRMRHQTPEVDFLGRDKWYVPENSLALSKLRRAIRKQPSLEVRRFLWVTLAETARITSNSRTSTYKLHIRPPDEIPLMSNRAPIELFAILAARNIQQLRSIQETLTAKGLVEDGRYRGTIRLEVGDALEPFTWQQWGGKFDLLVTSPPYGDNTSTVPYGQNSYLPLQWIPFKDLGCKADKQWLRSTQEIDRRSLGGRWAGSMLDLSADFVVRSPKLRSVLQDLATLKRDRAQRVAIFFRDFGQTIANLIPSLRRNAYMVWTVGNRRVGDREIPMDDILGEYLLSYGCVEVLRLQRPIVSKRMASKNAIASSTMKREIILVYRKAT